MQFREAAIDGVIWKPLRFFNDSRGWLCEIFRHDELPPEFHPAMAYVSETRPGVCRGPHEHVAQADCFGFLGPSNFMLHLWDNRPLSPTYSHYQSALVGAHRPMVVVIPPGVVHAYQNVGSGPGWVINCPNQLYRGAGKCEPVDEIRHEDDPESVFVIPGRRAA
jgi:dTDP-4-dehydrorhamnose 3,5-epimerase